MIKSELTKGRRPLFSMTFFKAKKIEPEFSKRSLCNVYSQLVYCINCICIMFFLYSCFVCNRTCHTILYEQSCLSQPACKCKPTHVSVFGYFVNINKLKPPDNPDGSK